MERYILRYLFLLVLCLTLGVPALGQSVSTPTGATKVAAEADKDKADGKAATAMPPKDSATVSLLTCSPGKLVYEQFGHTALRVREYHNGTWSDWVFNYGSFSFAQPHFLWRFVLGKTDYELSVVPYVLFYDSYAKEGRAIYEQRLDLTPNEVRRLIDALADNLQPSKATYRYNFFYDNCVTRALDRISEAVDGEIVWPEVKTEDMTLRDIVHEFTPADSWYRFGQDLLLGAEVDHPADRRLRMFSPVYAERYVSEAKVRRAGEALRPLAAPIITLLPAVPAPLTTGIQFTPMWAFGLLLAFVAGVTYYEYRRKRYFWVLDVVLLIAQGLVGCIITFLFFFSSHPAVGSNFLITMFNPLPLLYFPWVMKCAVAGRPARGLYVQGVMLLATLIIGWSGIQQFPPELNLIIAALALRFAAHFAFVRYSLVRTNA